METTWKTVPGFEDYEVSNAGDVRNSQSERILKQRVNKGYFVVDLRKDGSRKTCYAHRLVACAFLDNSDNREFVDHVDNNRQNNHVSNLRWATSQENSRHTSKRTQKQTSRFKGVYHEKSRKKWYAHIVLDGKRIFLGRFTDEADAGRAYNHAARKLFKDFAKLNDISDSESEESETDDSDSDSADE